MQTQNNGYNIKMSSKFDQSSNGPVFSSRSCPPCLLAGKQPWPGIARVSLPKVVTISFQKVISRRHFYALLFLFFSFLSTWAFTYRFLLLLYHTSATSSHLDLDVAQVLKKGWGLS